MTKTCCQSADFFTPLGTRISELVAHLDAGEYQLLVILSEFDEKKEWSVSGINSCAHWLNVYCGMLPVFASRNRDDGLPVALKSNPVIPEAPKALSGTRAATPENEDVLLNIARYGTANHVEKLVRNYRRSDALARMAEVFLAGTNSQAGGGDAYLVNIHTDVDTLMADGEGTHSELDDGGHVSAETSSS